MKRTQLLTKFEPSHRLVQEVDQQITQTEATIAAENALPLRDETTDKNAHYEWAQSELQQSQVQLKSPASAGGGDRYAGSRLPGDGAATGRGRDYAG